MTKKLAILFLMAILIVALATALGCGKKAEEATPAAGTTDTTAQTTPAPAESGAATTPAPAPADTTAGK